MKKYFRSSLMLAVMTVITGMLLVSALPYAEASEREIIASGKNMSVNWTLYDDGELYIDGTDFWNSTPWKSYYSSIKKITIAKNVKSSSVLGFYFDVAEGYSNLESVSVEEGNTSFFSDENGVLYSKDKTKIYLFPAASELTEYHIPDSVTTIGSGAFCGSKNVTEITGCKGLKTVSENAFYFSSVENITLPNGTETIGRHAFFNSLLKNITVPDSVTTIGTYAFKNCSGLETASVGNGITELTTETFSGCTALKKISLPKGLKTIGQNAFENCSALTEMNLPEGLTSLLSNAFSGCSSLQSIVIPEGITSLSAYLFKNCTSLKNVTLPSNLKSASSFAFSGCKAVENVYYTGDEAGWSSIKFGSNSSNPLEFADNFYIDGKLVTEFEFPYGITEISGYVFKNYAKLKGVTIPNTVKSIGDYAFNYCKALKSVDIPDSVTHIGEHAFSYCSVLDEISASANLEYIGKSAFLYSGYYNDYAKWDNGFLYLGDYLLSVDSKKVAADCRIYSKTRLIASGAFSSNQKITSVTMGDKVEYINEEAFYRCPNLKTVYLSSNLKKISDSSFASCSALESINIPQSVSAIEDKAFWKCASLTEIDIPKNVVSIGNSAFCGCGKLEKIRLSEGLKEIGASAFAETSSLTEISLPESLTALAAGAFNSSAVKDIYYGSVKENWKRVSKNADFSGITVHYTIKNAEETVMIIHTDDDFDYESGNVNLEVTQVDKVTSKFVQNEFYSRLFVNPIQILDIRLVDGDGNPIQPLPDQKITVKIKSTEEFQNHLLSGLSSAGDYNVAAQDIGFANDSFVFMLNGKKTAVPASESFLSSFSIIHWYSDAVKPSDFEPFTHSQIAVENGYIILETNHFSEYAVCTELLRFEAEEAELRSGESLSLSVIAQQGTEVIYSSSDESVAVVDENGVVTAVGPGSATITVIINGTNISDACEITVPARKFTVKWIVDGEETEQTVTEQTVITQPQNPEKNGYVFKGWTPAVPDTMPAHDLTFTAVFEKIYVTGISIVTLPKKVQYTYKTDSLDLSGIVVKVNYSDGSSKLVTETNALKAEGFSSDKAGKQTVTVRYGGCSAAFEVEVSYTFWQWIIRILLLGFLWY